MIEDGIKLIPGMVCEHDEGLGYRIDDLRPDLTEWERTKEFGRTIVNYTQLEDGSLPAGTKYSREESDFRKVFTFLCRPF